MASLQPCVCSEFWIRLCIVVLVYLYIENPSINFLIIPFFSPQVAENWKCSSACYQTATRLTSLYLNRLYLCSLFAFCRHILNSFQVFLAIIWETGEKKKKRNTFWLLWSCTLNFAAQIQVCLAYTLTDIEDLWSLKELTVNSSSRYFFPLHLGFTLLFNGWTKTSSFKLVLKSTCTEIDLLSYLLGGEIILTLILHKQKHFLCMGDVLVPWMKCNFFLSQVSEQIKACPGWLILTVFDW